MDVETDPREGTSFQCDVSVKVEEDDENTYSMDLLELAQCVQTNEDPIEFNSTDAMMNPKTGQMVCLHCLEDCNANMLADHMINAHNYRKVLFKCQICQDTFLEKTALLDHKTKCRLPTRRRKLKTLQQIMKDIDKSPDKSDTDTSICPICLLELTHGKLKEHLVAEHSNPDLTVTCGKCNRNFKSKFTLREHIKLVHEAVEDSVECELCGQKFRSLKYLSNHKRNVHPSGDKIHACTVCGKEFKSRLCLHQHTKYVHPPEGASVGCPHCSHKVFKSKLNLQQHLKASHHINKNANK